MLVKTQLRNQFNLNMVHAKVQYYMQNLQVTFILIFVIVKSYKDWHT